MIVWVNLESMFVLDIAHRKRTFTEAKQCNTRLLEILLYYYIRTDINAVLKLNKLSLRTKFKCTSALDK